MLIQDVAERLPRLVRPSGFYSLLLFHVGTEDNARGDQGNFKPDYTVLVVMVKCPQGPGDDVLDPATEGKGHEV